MVRTMTVRRVVPLLVCLLATFAVAMAQPKKAPPAPAKDPAPTPATGSGSGSAEAPPPVDEGPPPDMDGKDENPGAPRPLPGEEPKVVVVAPEAKPKTSGYPMEEVIRGRLGTIKFVRGGFLVYRDDPGRGSDGLHPRCSWGSCSAA